MRFGRIRNASARTHASIESPQRPSIEPLEQRQLLSISPFPLSRVLPADVGIGIQAPVGVDVGSVSGTVSDPTGAPIAGALVIIVPAKPAGTTGSPTLPPERVLLAKTDASGKFSLAKVPVGTYTATAHKDGFNNATSAPFAVTKDQNTDVSLTLAPVQTGSVSGSVVDAAGKGIAGAVVVLSPTAPTTGGSPIVLPPGRELFAITDASGNYSIDKVPTGTYTATAFKVGYQKATSASFAVTQGKNIAIPPITLTTVPAPVFGSVTGSVTDTAGKPLAGAFVVISPAPSTTGGSGGTTKPGMPPLPTQVAVTDKNGQYTFAKVRTGSYVVTAFARGYQKATSAPFTVAQGSNTAPTLALTALPTPAFGTVTGLVTDSAGKPLAGAFVEISPASTTTGGTSGTKLPGPPPHIRVAITDKNGQYTFNDVPTGTYTVSAIAKGYQKATSAPFTVAKGSNTAPTLALTALPTPDVGSVTGKVTDSKGNALAGAFVALSPAPANTPGTTTVPFPLPPVRVAKTDQNGQYTFDNVPTGTYTVTAFADGYQKATSAPFTVANGSNTAPTLALAALPTPVFGSVTGKVTDSSGKPLAGAYVAISPAGSPKPEAGATASPINFPPVPVQFVKTDANGQYTFDKVAAGSYVVTAFDPGYQPATSAPFTVSQGSNTAPTLVLMLGKPMPMPL